MSENQFLAAPHQRYEDHPIAGVFPLLGDDELEVLAADIGANGLREPITLHDGMILDGRNRYRACLKAAVEPRFRAFQGESPTAFVLSLNLHRRHLTQSQKACVAVEVEKHFAGEARARMALGGGDKRSGTQKIADPIQGKGESRQQAAAAVGVNHAYVSVAKALKETAPGLFEEVQAGAKSLQDAKRQLKAERQEAERAENRAKVAAAKKPEELEGVYCTIVMDPPWDFSEEGDHDVMGRTRPRYAQMSESEIAALPVGKLAAKDAHLYLWITNRSLLTGKGWRLCEVWGFRPITILTWCKPVIGVGNYFRNNTEQLLFAVKGSLPLNVKNEGTWFQWGGARREHSEKPDESYELIERCSPGPYLEMFSRCPREGWITWGAEAQE